MPYSACAKYANEIRAKFTGELCAVVVLTKTAFAVHKYYTPFIKRSQYKIWIFLKKITALRILKGLFINVMLKQAMKPQMLWAVRCQDIPKRLCISCLQDFRYC